MDHPHLELATGLSYGLAFVAGLAGSGHCLGMCGGLVSAFFMKLGARGVWPYLAYHGGRIGIYGLVGALAAALGAVLVASGRFGLWQGGLQMLAGLVVSVLGLEMLGWSPWRNRLGFAPVVWVRRQFLGAVQRGPLQGALLGGALNGLMPCSMTMAMAVKASTAAGPGEGALLMLAFGAGTLPAMLAASVLFGRLGPRLRGGLQKLAALCVLVLGLLTLGQGLRFSLTLYKLVG
ncbi:MAG: hypothetical protein RIR00_498 [Pseudomonadota bacterium]|jgi:sulfite exporter TauE/SafE